MKIKQEIQLQHPEQSNKTLTIRMYKSDNERFIVKYFYSVDNQYLQEYDKTEVPVNASQAKLVFDNLVAYKLQKGYVNTQKDDNRALEPLSEQKRETQDVIILQHLTAAANGTYDGTWKLSRIIWRAGELKIKTAVPYLLKLSNPKDEIFQYSLIWTLGRLADETALPLLEKTLKIKVKKTILKNITREALANVYQNDKKQDFYKQLQSELPEDFNQNLITSDFSLALDWLRKNCSNDQKTNYLLPLLYTISKEHNLLRQALLAFIRDMPLKPKHFKAFRQIFKAAEFRQDGEMFGLMAYRLEKVNENYRSSANYVYSGNDYIQKKEGQKNGKLAYSDKTRGFLKRRVWRTLKRMGEAGDTNYINMAVGVLLPYNDKTDNTRAYETTDWVFNKQTGRYHKRTYRYDEQSNFLNFFHVLYSNSPRYTLPRGAKGWVCDDDYTTGGDAPESREEAFPALWNNQPLALVELLSKSEAGRVHEFATKALSQHPNFQEIIQNIDTATILAFLQKTFATTNELGLNVAIHRYTKHQPQLDLVAALMLSPLKKANEIAQNWIFANTKVFFENIDFIVSLVSSENENTQNWITTNFNAEFLNENKKKTLIDNLLHLILNTKPRITNY